MQNVGCARFVKDFETGAITSKWVFYGGLVPVCGVASADGQPGETFLGTYKFKMTDSHGNVVWWRLVIEEENSNVILSWFNEDDELKHRGVGVVEGDTMSVGWVQWEERD